MSVFTVRVSDRLAGIDSAQVQSYLAEYFRRPTPLAPDPGSGDARLSLSLDRRAVRVLAAATDQPVSSALRSLIFSHVGALPSPRPAVRLPGPMVSVPAWASRSEVLDAEFDDVRESPALRAMQAPSPRRGVPAVQAPASGALEWWGCDHCGGVNRGRAIRCGCGAWSPWSGLVSPDVRGWSQFQNCGVPEPIYTFAEGGVPALSGLVDAAVGLGVLVLLGWGLWKLLSAGGAAAGVASAAAGASVATVASAAFRTWRPMV